MQNFYPPDAPPAGIHPRDALRRLCALRHDMLSRPSSASSARGPSPYTFRVAHGADAAYPAASHTARSQPQPHPYPTTSQPQPADGISPSLERGPASRDNSVSPTRPRPPTKQATTRPFSARPLSAVADRFAELHHLNKPTAQSLARSNIVRPSEPETIYISKSSSPARPSTARSMPPRPLTLQSKGSLSVISTTSASVLTQNTASTNSNNYVPACDSVSPNSTNNNSDSLVTPGTTVPPIIAFTHVPAPQAMPSRSPAFAKKGTPLMEDEGVSSSSSSGYSLAPALATHSETQVPPIQAVTSTTLSDDAPSSQDQPFAKTASPKGQSQLDNPSKVDTGRRLTAVSFDKFMDTDSDNDDVGANTSGDSEATSSTSPNLVGAGRRPTAKPSGSIIRVPKLSTPEASLIGPLVMTPALPTSPSPGSEGGLSTRSHSQSSRAAARHQWRRASVSNMLRDDTLSKSRVISRRDAMWKLITGYILVKKSIRRWREDFARRHNGGLRRSSTLNTSFLNRSLTFESADDVIAKLESFNWHYTFPVKQVNVDGTVMKNAMLHLSTTHIHFSTDKTASTHRLADIMKIEPCPEGLQLTMTAKPGGGLQNINLLGPKHQQGDSTDRSPTPELALIVIVTDEADYLALHLFDYQSRILRAYATTLSRTLKQRMRRSLHVVHFNDVYHLPPFKPANAKGVIGGAARFHTVLHQIREHYNPLVLFSGDFMGPSLMSVITKGKQMIDAMNFLGVHYGCFGNHEFDFGLRTLKEVIFGYTQGKHIYTGSQTRWIMSNMTESDGSPLGGAKKVEICVWNGVRVGLLGLCENWLPQCNQLRPGEAHYENMYEVGERLALRLKHDEGCELVLALTHNRLPVDKELMQQCPSIDFLLGGHDHFYKSDPKHRVLKSGQEFEYLSFVDFGLGEDGTLSRVKIDTKPVMSDIAESDYMMGLITRYDEKMSEKLGKAIGTNSFALDSREETIRFREAKLPNFVLDIMQDESGADFAVLGAAAIAGKEEKPPGTVTIGDVFAWFPNDTKIMTLALKGSTIRKMLDVMVRELPAEAPSFPHPSRNLAFTINMILKPPRVMDIFIKGEPIDNETVYTVAVEEFVGMGKAKYKFVPVEAASVIVGDEMAPQLVHWVMDFFQKHKGTERSAESQAREEALKTVSKVVQTAARMEIDADVEKSQRFIRTVITQLLRCDRSAVFLIDDETNELYFTPDNKKEQIRFPKSAGIAGYVATHNEDVCIADVYQDSRFNPGVDKATGYRTRSMLACPVCLVDDKPIAVVQAINKEPSLNDGLFDDVDALMLRLLGEQVGFQLRNGEIFRAAAMAAHDAADASLQPGSEEQSFEQPTEDIDVMSKHVTAAFKGFASDVSMSFGDLLRSIEETAKKLVACESVKVFLRKPDSKGYFTLVDDVEDEENLETFQLDSGTLVEKVTEVKRVLSVSNVRDPRIWTDDRDANATIKCAMCAPMITSYGEVVGLITWINKRRPQGVDPKTYIPAFSTGDEFAAKYFGLFAAVSMLNTTRIQNINELRAESNLQAVPEIKLGRISIRGGWSTAKREIQRIIAMGKDKEQHDKRRQSVVFLPLPNGHGDPTQSIVPFDLIDTQGSADHMASASQHANANASMMTSVALISKKLFEPRKKSVKDSDDAGVSLSLGRHSEDSGGQSHDESRRKQSTNVTFSDIPAHSTSANASVNAAVASPVKSALRAGGITPPKATLEVPTSGSLQTSRSDVIDFNPPNAFVMTPLSNSQSKDDINA